MLPESTHFVKAESSHHEHAVDPRAWLEHFAVPRRSDHSTPEAAVHQVRQTVQRRLQWARDPTGDAHLNAVLEALQTDHAGALAYTASVIAYERLSCEGRQQVKATRVTPYLQEAMRDKTVTEKQAGLLRALEHAALQPADRVAASALIDRLKHGEAWR